MTQVRQKFHWYWPPGVTPVSINEWANTLSEAEKLEWVNGRARQHEMRQQAIDRGDMILLEGEYVWKDKETASRGKGIDEVWEKYWLRWQAETGVIFSSTLGE
jgi:hypothetical protein